MSRKKKHLTPALERAEPRVLPSATPLMHPPAMHRVAVDVKAIMWTLARTGNVVRAEARLDRLAATIPGGTEGLAPLWRGDLVLYRPHQASSIHAAERRMIGDFRRFVRPPVPPPAPPTPPPSGPTGPIAPPVVASLDSVRIRNTTGLALNVTVVLQVPQIQKPSITQTIPAQGSTPVLFDFGSATDAFMTISVKRADGGQVPPPLVNFNLPQPMNGYDGAVFTISVFGSTFNITPPT